MKKDYLEINGLKLEHLFEWECSSCYERFYTFHVYPKGVDTHKGKEYISCKSCGSPAYRTQKTISFTQEKLTIKKVIYMPRWFKIVLYGSLSYLLIKFVVNIELIIGGLWILLK